MWGGQLDIKPI